MTRETQINGYYKTVIEQSINSQCNVDTKLTSNEETKAINLNTLIKMKTLDNLISWKLRVCWFSENECLNQLIDQQSESDFDKDINLSREENEDDDEQRRHLHRVQHYHRHRAHRRCRRHQRHHQQQQG